MHNFDAETFAFKSLMVFVVAAAGILMVSNIRYYSFKEYRPQGAGALRRAACHRAGLRGYLSLEPSVMLLGLFGCYVASGPIMALGRKLRGNK